MLTACCTSPAPTASTAPSRSGSSGAYFSEGAAIGGPATLERLAVEAGIPEHEVREVLLTERYADEVRDDQRTAASLGISAVPFFVVDRSIAASGAQPPEVLGELLRRAMSTEPAVRTA